MFLVGRRKDKHPKNKLTMAEFVHSLLLCNVTVGHEKVPWHNLHIFFSVMFSLLKFADCVSEGVSSSNRKVRKPAKRINAEKQF